MIAGHAARNSRLPIDLTVVIDVSGPTSDIWQKPASAAEGTRRVADRVARLRELLRPGASIRTQGSQVVGQQLGDIRGRHVLLLDDILDSGHTLNAIRRKLEEARPLSVRVCVLLEKQISRAAAVEADYVGFKIGNEFVVGYGLDYMERYRNLPCIGVLRKEKILPVPAS